MKVFIFCLCSIFIFYATPATIASPTVLPPAQSLQADWLDQNVDPGENFYKFANGNWQKQNPIPAAYPLWSVMTVLHQKNQRIIKQLVTAIANDSSNKPGSIEQKIGDFYFSGMNQAAIDREGSAPLQPEWQRIEKMQQLTDLYDELAHLQSMGINALFNFGEMQDFHDSQRVIGAAGQGGLGLPDRDYYLEQDKKFQEIRHAYRAHIIKMFELLGDKTATATQAATTIMGIETALAQASISRIEQRNPHAIYHLMDLAQLQAVTPNFSWKLFLTKLNLPQVKQINLAMPAFFKFMDTEFKTVSLKDWKIYLRWHLIHAAAPYLSQPFVNENFRMVKTLTGVQELLPRWQRVLSAEDNALGFAIGKLYIEKTFPPSSKKAVQEILYHIRGALKYDLKNLAWMTPATRQAALQKLDLMEERIGYPDQWRDYSKLNIDRSIYVLNVLRAYQFLTAYELNKIGKPVDKNAWDMLPYEVNAYYDPSRNNLNIPAGILQPPLFDPTAPAAINYGAIGFVIGHEMTHGFDDEGSQFDGYGNLKNWWTAEDLKKFQAATTCIAKHFSHYTVEDHLHVQGKLVTGEATADLGGLILAYRAFHASPAYHQAMTINGWNPDQQFFLSAAHTWALNIRPEETRLRITTDPHPPAMARVNGTLANMPEFQRAYNILAPSSMVKSDRCIIW